MKVHKRILKFITFANWILFVVLSIFAVFMLPPDFARGIIMGGLIATVNFHLLYRTLKKALTPPNISSHKVVLAKYYIRFIASGFIIFILISKHFVNPIGLVIGLSVVVASIMIATVLELKKIVFKEAF